MVKIAQIILYNILGWKIHGVFQLPKKCVLIVAPHTHWIDFFLALLIRKAINQEINFIAKKELFIFPLDYILRYLGGIPVERNSKSKTVDLIAENFQKKKKFILGISPEGTRSKVSKWKTGFYYIAKKAKVPVICVSLNYIEKVVNFSQSFEISSNIHKDIDKFKGFFNGIKGKIGEYS